jgi:2,5-dihydroxypyridine 5,6-dioxygenase
MSMSLTELFVKQYKLCALDSSQTVAVIFEYGRKTEYVDAALAAARLLDASVLVLGASSLSNPTLPPYTADGREIPALLSAAGQCDLVIDLTVGGLIHSNVRTSIIGKGKRMLFVAEPADVLERMMGDEELRANIDAAAAILRQGKTLHVTSAAGTDLSYDIDLPDLPITCQWGFVDVPARWDHWPSGFVACFPRDRSAQGRIVLQAGDAIIPWQIYVQKPVHLTIKDGFITAIEGDGAEAFQLRDYFARWNDPNVYAMSHAGWGMHPNASWAAFNVYNPHSLYGQELRSVAGNFMWSTGSNRFAQRETPAHLDIPMRGCTVAVDGRVVVREGQLQSMTA